MKTFDFLTMFRSSYWIFKKMGVNFNDVKYLDLYLEYKSLILQGEKTTYIIMVLSKKYDICERNIYNIISRMEKDCNFSAFDLNL